MPSANSRKPASRARAALGATALLLAALDVPAAAQTTDLVSTTHFRVCADPANAPFSDRGGTGFENRLAELLAAELGLPVQYEWFPMATGFVRRTLRENRCDVIIGFAQGHELVLNTNHYYTSAYVLVTVPGSELDGVDALSDPRLKGRRLGIVAGSPPATHLARNGLIGLAKPYHLMVDRRFESPGEEMIADLKAGEIDAGILWGPIGGYFGGRAGMNVTPLLKETDPPKLFYRITMGVRQGEVVWKRKLNSLIRKNQDRIEAILSEYGVPLIDDMGQRLKTAGK